MEDTNSDYLVLARKWRPSAFSEVNGQQHIIRALRNAVRLNRLPNAYIFSGIRGVGKTSVARIVARSINCEKGPTEEPCGVCDNCGEIAEGRSLDVIEIDGASNNGVDEIREIREHLQYAPVKCRKKIYIVDEVHMLSRPAFNAFLKTLEEPPPHTLFIFATTEISKIPDTVLSRCQCFEFRALSEIEIKKKLAQIAEKENIRITDGALGMFARHANGSMRDAESLLDQIGAYAGEDIDENTIEVALGLVSREKIWNLLKGIINRDADATVSEVRGLFYGGYDVGVIIRELSEAVREMAVVKITSAPEKLLEETEENIGRIKKLVENISATRIQQFYDILLRADSKRRYAENGLAVLEMSLLNMIRLDDVVDIDSLIKNIKNRPAAGNPINPARPSGATYQKKTGNRPESVMEPRTATADWEKIRQAVKKEHPRISAMLGGITETAVEGDKLILFCPTNYLMKQCEINIKTIGEQIKKIAGKTVEAVLRPEERNGAAQVNGKKKAWDNHVKKKMIENPIIEKAVEMFDGRPMFEE
jgi:DNA polymerase-3 subunit gamma/tau